MCSKKLKAALPHWLPFYEDGNGKLAEEVKSKLLMMSPATIDRLLKPSKVKYKQRGLCGTKPGSLLKNQIPIRTENRATWGKGSDGVIRQVKDIEKNLPFRLLGFDCDNGSEFLNYL